ncbi:MAG: DUF6514 family protein [Defluviitaleaceae bacterium]|nr:DUF6514 family protein [Defluviitaleaceae bacterium]
MGIMSMREQHLQGAVIENDEGQKWLLDYYVQTYEGLGGMELYGLKINKSTLDGVLIETEETFATSETYEEALAMAEAFARGTVPPVVLLEMVDEWEDEVKAAEDLPGISTSFLKKAGQKF